MANELVTALNTKVAGIPVWVAGAVVVGGILLVRKAGIFPSGSSTPSTASKAPTGSPGGDFSLGYASGLQAANTTTSPAPPTPAPTPGMVTLTGGQTGLFATPAFDLSQLVTWLPGGNQLPSAGSPVAGGSFGSGNEQSHFWQPVTYQGKTLYVWAPFARPDTSPTGGRGGGFPGRNGPRGIGSRSAELMHAAHPMVKQRPRFPHYAVAAGGPSGRSIHELAGAAGVHPGRLMVANPHLRDQGYVALPGQIVRIA
jgi:hypothetical protein